MFFHRDVERAGANELASLPYAMAARLFARVMNSSLRKNGDRYENEIKVRSNYGKYSLDMYLRALCGSLDKSKSTK